MIDVQEIRKQIDMGVLISRPTRNQIVDEAIEMRQLLRDIHSAMLEKETLASIAIKYGDVFHRMTPFVTKED